MKIMLEKTDDEHSITMPEILTELERYQVSAERKSIYSDLQALEKLGVEVIGEAGRGIWLTRHVGKQAV